MKAFTRDQATAFVSAMQRLLHRFDLDSIDANSDGQVVLYNRDGKRVGSFESIDITEGAVDISYQHL